MMNGLIRTYGDVSTRGAIIGSNAGDIKVSHNCYDASININGGVNNSDVDGIYRLSSVELTSGEVIDGFTSDIFDFKKNNYPVLKQFADESYSDALRSMYIGFSKGQLRSNITSDIPLPVKEGLVYTLKNNDKFTISDESLKIEELTGMSVVKDEITLTLINKYTKKFDIASIPVILKGTGSAENPYLIETPADWNKLSEFIASSKWEYNDSHFVLTNDLDFKNDSIKSIAYGSVKFHGVLDGKGHTIKNYVYSNLNSSLSKFEGPNCYAGRQLGLFGSIGSFGKVSNLIIDGSFAGYTNVGGLVGELYGTVEKVIHKGTVSTPNSTNVGGIAYRVNEGGIIADCENQGTVKSKTSNSAGIAYASKSTSTVIRCINRGNIEGTYGSAGIVYDLAGSAVSCENRGVFTAGYNIAGIAYNVQVTASLDSCINYSDLTATHASSGSVYGICGMSSTATRVADTNLPGGYIRNCINYGHLRAPKDVYGIAFALKNGWVMSNCNNYGNLLAINDVPTKAAGNVAGIVGIIGDSGKGATNNLTYLTNCHNYGQITGYGQKICGIAHQSYNYVIISDCSNYGDITNHYVAVVPMTAGIIGSHNGRMFNCYNKGNILCGSNGVAGIATLMQNGAQDYTSLMENCFNTGNVTSTYTAAATQGHAAGIVGYFAINAAATWSATVRNCYNAGNIRGKERIAGICAGAFSNRQEIYNCYNSGQVIADSTIWSGTFFANNPDFISTSHNCYYDKTRSYAKADMEMNGSGKSTSELSGLQISDNFITNKNNGYPILKGFEDRDEARISSVLLLLSDESKENHGSIAKEFDLVAPDEAIWSVSFANSIANNNDETASSYIEISGKKAKPVKEGEVILTCKLGDYERHFLLILKPDMTGNLYVESGKEIKSIKYYDLDGREISSSTKGIACIRIITFIDGSTETSKILSKL